MSHRLNCPTEWEARHEGERAFDYGRSRASNPYEDSYGNRERACPEAADDWRSGYRRAEMREEERHEEEAAHRRAEMRRAELQAEEEYYAHPEQQYEPEPFNEGEYIRSECASGGHVIHGGDRFGARCYCGRVRYLDVAKQE